MFKINKFIMTACLLWAAGNFAYASPGYSQTRGELLYSTHCIACHTEIIHWREKTLATDWQSLETQVRRWQSNLSLSWSEDEITDVTHYLNKAYYHFPINDEQDFTKSNDPYPDASP
jgi:hypothetical protein